MRSVRSLFNWQSSGWAGLVLVISVTTLFILRTFSYDFVIGKAPYWQTQVDDVTQYIAGFNMYFTAPWQVPLLGFDSLNYPTGTRVTFVDAIPIYAMLLKALLPRSLAPFNPFGFWVALCFTLQGVGAWWIARELRIRSWFFLTGLLVLFLTYPALMSRIGHISLMSHWILLFAIALYVRSYRLSSLPRYAWTFLLVSAFYINIYLFVMACGVLLAGLLDLGRRIGVRDIVDFLLPFALLATTSLLMMMPLSLAEVTREWGFGYYSMNLLAPITGGKVFAVQVAEVAGQHEGFNYLGLGVLVALVAAFSLRNRLATEVLHRHYALVFLLLLYSVYALSNQIYFGSQQILLLRYPTSLDGLTSQFRASGRFFWLVGYFLIIFSMLALYRGLGRRVFVVVSSMLVCLQIADLGDRYEVLRTSLVRDSPRPMNFALWDARLGDSVNTLYFYPKFKCGQPAHETLLPVMRYAAERGFNLNTGYISRYTPDCQDVEREIAASNPKQAAYIFARSDYPSPDIVMELFPKNFRIRCTEIQFAHLCLSVHEGDHL